MLVPESISQINSVTHQKDSHKDRQLSGQNQNRHLSLPREEEADVLKRPLKTSRGWTIVEKSHKTRDLTGFSALIVAQTYIYFKTLGGTHFGIQRWLTRHF